MLYTSIVSVLSVHQNEWCACSKRNWTWNSNTKKIIKNLAEPANGQALYNRYINLSINCHAFGIEIRTQRSKTVHSLAGASSCQSTCLPIQNPASNGRKIVCNYCVRTARSANAVGGGEWGRRLYCTSACYMRLYLHKNVKNTHKLHRSQASCAESVSVNKNLKRLTNFMNEINKYKFQNWSKSVFDVDFCAASRRPPWMSNTNAMRPQAGRLWGGARGISPRHQQKSCKLNIWQLFLWAG